MRNKLTVGSLFAGIGGFDLGFERVGCFEIAWQVEKDEFCQKVLEKHWPAVRRWPDVKTFPPEPIDDWRCDIIVGGDPCQANSCARGNFPTKHESLGDEFIRVVKTLRPCVVLRENPAGELLDAPWPSRRFKHNLEALGYAAIRFRLRACCLGGNIQAERMFVLGLDPQAVGNLMERRICQLQSPSVADLSALVRNYVWPAIPRPRGYRSRCGLPNYVERIRAIGNALPPQMSEFLARCIAYAFGLL
ncbi:MAG: hypothetical protein KatS3mg087_1052 [Patescibacteria group bacterium]|nr:MAG: hypothetical protein KatS3mg087_1052 [Patescibacteria group bacterium]